jgi:outer membrane lipoprotein SlyB
LRLATCGFTIIDETVKGIRMKKRLAAIAAMAILVGTPMSVIALGKNEKGCLAGGAIGGLGGHLIGSGSTTNTVLGAAAGCAVGTVVADKRKKSSSRSNERSKTAHYSDRDAQARRDREYRRVNGQS